MQFSCYALVLLDIAVDKPLTYGVPEDLVNATAKGSRVVVSVRNKEQFGYVLSVSEKCSLSKVQPIRRIIHEELISPELFELALWMNSYYCTSLRQVLKIILPPSVRSETKHKEQFFIARAKTRDELAIECIKVREKFPAQAAILDVMLKVNKGILLSKLLEECSCSKSPLDSLIKKGLLKMELMRIHRSPLSNEEYFLSKPKKLNEEQQEAFTKISKAIESEKFEAHLLFGVTGSGKTEVYLQAIAQALEKGKGAIMLVPEIALTDQTIKRFRSRFDSSIAILHHRLSAGERFDEWHRLKRGEARIAIGARSAIFCPVANLGLIIVDEEHETSYKQNEEQPCYQARDVAVMRAKMEKAVVLLGSATPSLESYYNAQKGKYVLSALSCRPSAALLPKVTIVDMRQEMPKAGGFTNFSELLLEKIKEKYEQAEQTILFLNRRGYHTSVFCPECQKAVSCQHCDLSLTFHRSENVLSCHLCGFTLPFLTECLSCNKAIPLKFRGVGTELVEKSLNAIFPQLKILRLDADTTKHKGSHQQILQQFSCGKADVLIGTQMVAKGLHFPSVTLVGVLNSDASLQIPDFRASESCFQLITQVSGRAGRGELRGEVVIQTFSPDNSTIFFASKNDYQSFYNQELNSRKQFFYPPFVQLGKVLFSGEDEKQTELFAQQFHEKVINFLPKSYEVNPVLPSAYAKVKDRFRMQFFVKGEQAAPIAKAFLLAQAALSKKNTIKVTIDINPSSTYF